MSNTSIFHHGCKQLHLLGNCCSEPDCNECGQDEIDIFGDDSEFGFGEPVSMDGCLDKGRRFLCSQSNCGDIHRSCCDTGEWGGVQHEWFNSCILQGCGCGQPGIHRWNAVQIDEQIPSGVDIGHNHLVQGICWIQCVDYRRWHILQLLDDNLDESGWNNSIATNEFNNSKCDVFGCEWSCVSYSIGRTGGLVSCRVWKYGILQWRFTTEPDFISS